MCSDDNEDNVDDVNEFKLPVLDSSPPNLLLTDALNCVKSIPSIVPVKSMEPDTTIPSPKTTLVPPDDVILKPS